MNKIIKIADGKIYIGKDDGSIVETDISNANWEAKVGDEVEVFTSNETIILNLAKKAKEKKSCPVIVKKTIKACQKILPMVFTSLFALFLIALIAICVVPKGKNYKCVKVDVMGIDATESVTSTIKFKDDKMELSVLMPIAEIDETIAHFYEIRDGKLYMFSDETRRYEYLGEISSTKISILEPETGMKMEFEEKTMTALKTLSIVFMVISIVLDAAAITVMFLTKKGIIKVDGEAVATVVSTVSSEAPEAEASAEVSESTTTTDGE